MKLRATAVLVLGSVLAVSVGCTTLPTEGPVRQAAERSFVPDPVAVRRLAPPPQAGASPEDIVRGFLLASASVSDGYASARRYLTRGTGSRWRTDQGVVVVERFTSPEAALQQSPPASMRPPAGGDTTVVLEGIQVATIDALAAYEIVRPARPVTVTFGLRVENGEWRIADVPAQLYLLRYDVERVYRSVNVYYPAREGDRMVPDPVVLPAGESLAGELVARLLQGPRPALAGAVRSPFPRWERPDNFTVPIRGRVAEVDITGVRLPEEFAREDFSAQLVWTLKQVPEVTAVRISINGSLLEVPGVPSPQPLSAWAGVDPSVLGTGVVRAYAVQNGRVGRLEAPGFTPLPGASGSGRFDLVAPAVSIDGRTVVAISSDRSRLYRGAIGFSEPLHVLMRGSGLADSSIDSSGTVWVLASGADTPSIWAIDGDRPPTKVQTPDTLGSIREMRVSRDGLRLGLVARRDGREEVYVGLLRRDPQAPDDIRLIDLRHVAPQLRFVRDITWQGPARLAVLATDSGNGVQPYLLSLDGFAIEALGPLLAADAVTLSAAPGGAPLLAGTENRRIYSASGRTWRERIRGQDPTYPG